jgi:hypothetical protein
MKRMMELSLQLRRIAEKNGLGNGTELLNVFACSFMKVDWCISINFD